MFWDFKPEHLSDSWKSVWQGIPFLANLIKEAPTPELTKMIQSGFIGLMTAVFVGAGGVFWVLFTQTLPALQTGQAVLINQNSAMQEDIKNVKADLVIIKSQRLSPSESKEHEVSQQELILKNWKSIKELQQSIPKIHKLPKGLENEDS